MTDMTIAFAPLVDIYIIAALGAVGFILAAYGVWRGAPGSLLRGAIALLLVLALANPAAVSEERDPLKDVAVVLVDETPSQQLADRASQTEIALEEVLASLENYSETLEVRVARIAHDAVDDAAKGTRILSTLQQTLADVPPRRVAGTILITDGQVHDAGLLDTRSGPQGAGPRVPSGAGPNTRQDTAEGQSETSVSAIPSIPGPVHSLLTGARDEADRRLTILESPSFGLVGEDVTIKIRVDDPAATQSAVRVTIKVDGVFQRAARVPIGGEGEITIPLTHRGMTVVELQAPEGEQEITLSNNRSVLAINGVRDRLRVLLVSGEPHPGERTWRNLLKSDPSVDLVHFTILRPPEKQDGTPIHELSLIAFPTRELFEVKLHEFDLVVFDRFRRRGVLPSLYLANIVEYVENGGAFLEAVGPSFAGPYSLYRTPLGKLLPGEPTGAITMRGYTPDISDLGKRHPVTAALPGGPRYGEEGDPRWGRWFRQVEVRDGRGQTLMTGADDQPLLILDRAAEGRIAQILSDHIWLWARGFEGGGPQRELLRRLAHWLMKEPDLEEEDLRAVSAGGQLSITRRSMQDRTFSVTVTDPDGNMAEHPLTNTNDGVHAVAIPMTKAGIYTISDGEKTVLTAVGELNPLEFDEVAATEDQVAVLAEATDGSVSWLSDELPRVRRTDPERPASGAGWIGLRENGDYVVTGVRAANLLPAPLLLAILIALLALAWRRESK